MQHSLSFVLVALVSLNTAASHALLKHAMSTVSFPHAIADVPAFIGHCVVAPAVWASLALQVLGYLAWLAILAREQLAVSVALSGVFFYCATAAIGWLAFSERLTAHQWIGLGFVAAGGVLVSMRAST